MSYYSNIQKAIDFIEINLQEDIKLEEIAKASGYSIPHFYRVFAPLVGCSVKEYVRKRKLSNAAYDLATSKRSITDIAFDYGYGSHEAFTRTFKLTYGKSPSSFRKVNGEPWLYEKVNLLSNNKKDGVVILKPEIICKDERLLLGIARKVNQGENLKFNLLSNIKNKFMEMSEEIKNRVNIELHYAAYDYDVQDISKDENEINYIYFYGIEVSECSNIPLGMVMRVIPKAKYAVFHYDTMNNTLNGESLSQPVYDYIDGIWLPSSGFELSETSDYEVINQAESLIDYYISIK
ncbi:AraC family transcriptional regulator [Alloiococcus sp. CFN-8]|uniref:AraC family transcriptional regulator n=1 Tax=Alloiococcus sp. CFN-8 TaxID=3416081 RepID=UPI003CF28BEC